jgi:hypothetical protein
VGIAGIDSRDRLADCAGEDSVIPGVEFPSLFVEGCVWFLASILLGLVDLLYRSRVVRRMGGDEDGR